LMTMAMLSGEKKVCVASEAIVFSETIDAYAWMIRATVEMTPSVRLCDTKVIYGDGILGGGKLLEQLGIQTTCRVVLDHQHLLSDDIGAWPKRFGRTWAQVKEDCIKMVKTYDEQTYNACLDRIRATVRHNPRLVAYLDEKIHAKRHMFANHQVQHYPLNLARQGNAPAEANHSSIVRRLGPFYSSPVKLIEALLKRHKDISSSRHNMLLKYHGQKLTEADAITNVTLKRASLSLTSWGMELFESCMKASAKMEMLTNENNCVFVDKKNRDMVLFTLNRHATTCHCRFWKAYHLQCPHLLLLHKGYCENLCSRRWLQLSGLGTSVGDGRHNLEQAAGDGSGVADFSNSNEEIGVAAAASGAAAATQVGVDGVDVATTGVRLGGDIDRNIEFGDIIKVAHELAQSVANMSSRSHKNQFFGEMIRLAERVKGNLEAGNEMSHGTLVDSHFCMYNGRKMNEDTRLGAGGSIVGDVTGMKRACPRPACNHSRKRLKSKEEKRNDSRRQMMISTTRKPCCTLCGDEGHRATGTRCRVVVTFKAPLIGWSDVMEMAEKLGNPMYYDVKHPNDETRKYIRQWFSRGGPHKIPSDGLHLVLWNTYFSSTDNLVSSKNLIEVTVLGKGGIELSGWGNVYFPAHEIREWLIKNCSMAQRKKHVLSNLRSIVCLTESGSSQVT
jgi:hypothetical protein